MCDVPQSVAVSLLHRNATLIFKFHRLWHINFQIPHIVVTISLIAGTVSLIVGAVPLILVANSYIVIAVSLIGSYFTDLVAISQTLATVLQNVVAIFHIFLLRIKCFFLLMFVHSCTLCFCPQCLQMPVSLNSDGPQAVCDMNINI